MPRRPRAFAAGTFHIAAHGSDLRYLFASDADREDFLDRIAVVCERFELGLLSYVLMGSHYHLAIRLPDARISRGLQWLHTEYSRDQNRRYGRNAHLFRAHAGAGGRERRRPRRHLPLHRPDPVEAKLVRDPFAWRWGSARAHAELERPRIPLEDSRTRGRLRRRRMAQ